MEMVQGVSGSFDIASNNDSSFAARIFYSEQYDETTGKHIVSITGISIQSKIYGDNGIGWYPNGSISVDSEVVGTMNNSNPASHRVSLTAGSGWHVIYLTDDGRTNGFKDFPWQSSVISSDADGNKKVTVSVDFLMYRESSAPKPTFIGSQEIVLTKVAPRHLVTYNDNGTPVKCEVYRNDNGTAIRCGVYYNDNGNCVEV